MTKFDKVASYLFGDLGLGHVMWGVGIGTLALPGDWVFAGLALFTGFCGMTASYSYQVSHDQ